MADARALSGLLSDRARARVWSAVVLGATTTAQIAGQADLDEAAVTRALRQLSGVRLVRQTDGAWSPRLATLADAAAGRDRDPAYDGGDSPHASLLRTAFGPDGRLRAMPAGPTKQRVVLEHIVVRFEPGVRYPEAAVNDVLHDYSEDHAMLRRYLVEADLLTRDDATAVCWRSGGPV